LPVGEINVVFGPNGAVAKDVPQLDSVICEDFADEQATVAMARVRLAA